MRGRLRLALVLGAAGIAGLVLPAPAMAQPAQPALLPNVPTWTRATEVTFTFTSDPGATFACRLDVPEYTPCTSPAPYTDLSEGAHSFHVRAANAAGESAPSRFDWTIDLTPPVLPANVLAEATSPAGATVTFVATDALDPSPQLHCTPGSGSTFPLGTTTVGCGATDAAGNQASGVIEVTVRDTPPGAVRGFSARGRDGLVRLRWLRPTDPDYRRVRIWRVQTGSGRTRLVAERRTAVRFTDRTAANEVRYRYVIRSFDRAGNRSRAVSAIARPSAVVSPAYGSLVRRPPLVDWRSVRNATYYNMQLWRNGRKLLSVWPLRSRYRLRSSWTFRGRQHSLTPGRLTVYVWPGFGAKAAVRYGPLLGSTSFRVG